jgi:cold shock CspA family protein
MQRGTLARWNDDRGFGFIKSENSPQEVFLHISALPKGIRRPQEGDIILYEVLREQNGKLKARTAQIEGVKVLQQKPNHSGEFFDLRPQALLAQLASIVIVAIISGTALISLLRTFNNQEVSTKSTTIPGTEINIPGELSPSCNIKGNISINTGKKWYHIPGMEDYESTSIDTSKGERWFCTEQEAIDAGWTKAPK